MKIGIIGAGSVGSACVYALIMRGCAREIVIIDKDIKRATAVSTDFQYGTSLSPRVEVYAGDYSMLAGAELVIITAGINEKTGGATDRNNPEGRLKLLNTNADIFKNIVPQITQSAADAVILVVTDPPDPLADIARHLAGHNKVLSAGTFLDSLRMQYHIAQHLKINPSSVQALVVGEHGTSQVFLWSTASVEGILVQNVLAQLNQTDDKFCQRIEDEVRYANISIIEGNDASQFGIGMATARIAEIILKDEQTVIPIGSYNENYEITLSLPSIVGKNGVSKILMPELSAQEKQALQNSATILKQSLAKIKY